MNAQEQAKYIEGLLQAQGATLEGMERQTYDRFMEATQTLKQASESLNATRAEVNRLSRVVEQSMGAQGALRQMLIDAEMARVKTEET